ncbi:MAG: BON domain-containing protein [Bryobacterales bacterium]|jgi:hyperosmotically inducible protein|nr:BON domain-containing protein [Bryobacterales bacterium]
MTNRNLGIATLAMLIVLAMGSVGSAQESERMQDRIGKQVRKELVMLPFYSLFDNFKFSVSPAGEVTLLGEVSRPTLKTDAERVVQRIEGVSKVTNQIEVLPLSPNDDRIRLATFNAIYGHPTLRPLAIRAVPPIHIIVKNGDITLEGVVNTKLEKQIAEMRARQVSGAFKVTNNLMVEQTGDNS